MEAWQHATWPIGHVDLLTMGLVTVADIPLQHFVDNATQAAQNTPGSAQQPPEQQAPGTLQQLVLVAADLLAGLAQSQADLQLAGSGSEALDNSGRHELDPAQLQHQMLHPAAVGALATRAYQLSSGSSQHALAILVAAALPDVDSSNVFLPDKLQPPWNLHTASAHDGAANAVDGPGSR